MTLSITLLAPAVFVVSLIIYALSLIVTAEPARTRLRDLAFFLVLCSVFLK